MKIGRRGFLLGSASALAMAGLPRLPAAVPQIAMGVDMATGKDSTFFMIMYPSAERDVWRILDGDQWSADEIDRLIEPGEFKRLDGFTFYKIEDHGTD